MTTPALVALHYDTQDIQDLDGIWLEIVRGLVEVVEVRGSDIVVPEVTGRLPSRRIADRLVIGLEGFVTGSGSGEAAQRADFRNNVQALNALFDPTATAALVADLEDGTTATITARPLSSVWDQIVPSFARVSIELESSDPDWVMT